MKEVNTVQTKLFDDTLPFAGSTYEAKHENCDGIFMLDNWQKSDGARIEHYIARTLGMPTFHRLDKLPIGSDWPEPTP